MIVRPIRTKKIIPGENNDIFEILSRYITNLRERSIVAITSKIVAIHQNRFVNSTIRVKDDLVREEADLYLTRSANKYRVMLTIKDNTLIAAAGIDSSNGYGNYILWPKNLQKITNEIRIFLKKRFSLREVGVIITDSKLSPLRRGTTGTFLAHSGFLALKDYRKKPDIFGRRLKITLANIAEGLAVAAVLVMGEGNEQTPFAIIEDLPFVKFRNTNPGKEELSFLKIDLKNDVFGNILSLAPWKKRNSSM